MESEALIEYMYSAFSEAPQPQRDEIAPHLCPECDGIRDRLSGVKAKAVPVSSMEWIGDGLPLLSPKALRYYLPRYLEFSITHQHLGACDLLLYHLAAENPEESYWAQRYSVFSPSEREAITSYLQYRSTWPDADVEREWVERGLRFWRPEGSS